VCCAAHVCACWVTRTVSKLFTDVDLLMCVCVSISSSLTIFIFFLNIIMRLGTSCSSCRHHVMSCHTMSS
jgi:hypothetical protein